MKRWMSAPLAALLCCTMFTGCEQEGMKKSHDKNAELKKDDMKMEGQRPDNRAMKQDTSKMNSGNPGKNAIDE